MTPAGPRIVRGRPSARRALQKGAALPACRSPTQKRRRVSSGNLKWTPISPRHVCSHMGTGALRARKWPTHGAAGAGFGEEAPTPGASRSECSILFLLFTVVETGLVLTTPLRQPLLWVKIGGSSGPGSSIFSPPSGPSRGPSKRGQDGAVLDGAALDDPS